MDPEQKFQLDFFWINPPLSILGNFFWGRKQQHPKIEEEVMVASSFCGFDDHDVDNDGGDDDGDVDDSCNESALIASHR